MKMEGVTTGNKGRQRPEVECAQRGTTHTVSDGGYRRQNLLRNVCILVHLRALRQTSLWQALPGMLAKRSTPACNPPADHPACQVFRPCLLAVAGGESGHRNLDNVPACRLPQHALDLGSDLQRVHVDMPARDRQTNLSKRLHLACRVHAPISPNIVVDLNAHLPVRSSQGVGRSAHMDHQVCAQRHMRARVGLVRLR